MIGEHIHSYEINAHLGQGGMGNVFRATDTMLGREVALKMLHPQLTVQPQFLERFKKEARILAQLLHPNIAVIYNFIEQGGNHFMVMEYVEGTSLDELLRKYRVLPPEFIVPVFIQALEGLQHAHRKNIFHRDIKPANLMITSDGTLKLMDFGIAKVAGEQKMTQVNKIIGTIEFMAPELIEGKEASALSDIYSMGATLYELVSGKIPFEADTDFNMMQAIMKAKLKSPDKLNPQLPKALNDIVLKAMEKNPVHRYADARAFQQALITAFPHYREINTSVLRKAQETVYAAKMTGELNLPQQTTVTPPPAKAKIELAGPLAVFLSGRQKKLIGMIRENKRRFLLVIALLVVVIIVFAVITISSSETSKTVVAQNDSLRQVVKNVTGDTIKNENAVLPPVDNTRLPKTDSRIPVNDNTVSNQGDIPIQGEGNERNRDDNPSAGKNRRSNTPTITPVEQNNRQKTREESAPEEKPAQKKEVVIHSEVIVTLSLSGMPDMNQKQKSAQRVSFTVSKPVYYEGVLIIRQGARASGSLTIGRVRTDVDIDQVEGANGAKIPLRPEHPHGRRGDIEEHTPFTALVPSGTRISF